jgi:hypothetical protein
MWSGCVLGPVLGTNRPACPDPLLLDRAAQIRPLCGLAGNHSRFVRFSAGQREPSLLRFSTSVRLQTALVQRAVAQDARRLQRHRTFRPIEPMLRRFYFNPTDPGRLDVLRELRRLRDSANFPKLYQHHRRRLPPAA